MRSWTLPCGSAVHPVWVAGNLKALPQTTGRAPAGGWVVPELRRVVLHVPTTRPCPFSDLLEVWCFFSGRAIATLRRSCRRNCLSRRSRRLRAALTLSTFIMSTAEAIFVQGDTQQTSRHSCGKMLLLLFLLLLFRTRARSAMCMSTPTLSCNDSKTLIYMCQVTWG